MVISPHRSAFHLLLLALLLPLSLGAQGGATGRIAGRIFNPATQEYVRNAEVSVEGTNLVVFSGDDGSYLLPNVPAGEAALAVAYTGYDRASARVTVSAGGTATRDFELRGSTFRAGARPAAGDTVVTLEKFIVSNEREGNAKAIMEQRAALNFKSVVASDNFGDVTGGNIGEFMKYMPGVVMDYVDADARAVRISGLDPKYATVSVDGMRMATAASASFGGGSRQFEFEQASITSIESIELNKTLTASMDADAPAGTMNLRSKNAFERKGREVTAQASLTASPYALTLRRTPGPGDGVHRKIRPGFVFTYADSFQGRFGVQLSLSANSLYNEQAGLTQTIDNNATRGPVINALVFRDNPKITTRAALGLNFDYRVTPHLIASLRTAFSHFNDEINARTLTFRANTADIDPSSTATYLLARATANATTRLEQNIGHSHKFNDTVTYTPKLEYRRNELQLTLGGGYSRSTTHYEDRRSGYFTGANNRITRMSWSARRSSPTSTDWQFTPLAGPAWTDLANYNRADPNPNNIGTVDRSGTSQVFLGYLDVKRAFLVAGLPVTVQTGVKTRLTTYDLNRIGARSWTYVGAAGDQLNPSTVMIAHTTPGIFDPRQGGNLAALNIPIPNTTAMLDLYRSQPGQFVENTYNNFLIERTTGRAIKEQVDAAYVEFNTRWRDVRLNLGVRRERTRTVGRTFDILPAALVRAAGYTPNTIPFLAYQYRNFVRFNKYGGYEHDFLSGGAKYSLARNLVLQLSANQSIGRPDYNNLAGVISVNDNNQTVQVPNPDLKPETSDKYYASVQYYIEPAGTLSVSAYRLNVRNLGVANRPVPAEEVGYADDPEYTGYTFLRPTNLDGVRRIKGVEVEYSQQLVFLPGIARGFSVFGSVSRAIPDLRLTNIVPKAANGGIRFSNHRFNLQLRSTWSSARATSIGVNQVQWQYERLMFDVSGGLKLGSTYEVTLSGRNILNSPNRGYADQPGNLRINMYYGAVWTLGLRGRF